MLSSSSCFRFYPQGPVEVAPYPHSPHPRGKAGIGSPRGWGWKGTLHKIFALLCAALCVRVAGVLGADLQWNLGTQRVSTKDVFWPKPFFFLEPRESPDAATIIPSRGGSKAPGSSRSFITAFFSKAQHSSPAPSSALRTGSPSHPLFQDEFSVTVQYTPGSSFPLSRASGRLVGLAGVPRLSGRAPLFCRTPWHSRGG